MQVKEESVGAVGLTDIAVDLLEPFRAAVIVPLVRMDTKPATEENVALVAPCGTTTEEGIVSPLIVVLRATEVPPAPAGADRVTVQVVEPPLSS